MTAGDRRCSCFKMFQTLGSSFQFNFDVLIHMDVFDLVLACKRLTSSQQIIVVLSKLIGTCFKIILFAPPIYLNRYWIEPLRKFGLFLLLLFRNWFFCIDRYHNHVRKDLMKIKLDLFFHCISSLQ